MCLCLRLFIFQKPSLCASARSIASLELHRFFALLSARNFIRNRVFNCNIKSMISSNKKRGALVVFEGCDRSGKSTQCNKLHEFLKEKNIDIQLRRYPERSTLCGGLINSYLKNDQDLNDQSIHLLFTVNRWENRDAVKKLLESGVTVIVDRYSFSGVACSVAKGLDFDWCKAPEKGLLKPDVVFYLKSSTNILSKRENFGEERYENVEFQRKAAEIFDRFCSEESNYWHKIEANLPIDTIHETICSKTLDVIEKIQFEELKTLW